MTYRSVSITFTKSFILVLAGLSLAAYAQASTLSNALKDWDPGMLQGNIMEVGSGYIYVNENKIIILDTSMGAKDIKTGIRDEKGRALDMKDLKKGTLVFIKGSHAIDEATKSEVMVATEIIVIPRILTPKDSGEYKWLTEPAKPW